MIKNAILLLKKREKVSIKSLIIVIFLHFERKIMKKNPHGSNEHHWRGGGEQTHFQNKYHEVIPILSLQFSRLPFDSCRFCSIFYSICFTFRIHELFTGCFRAKVKDFSQWLGNIHQVYVCMFACPLSGREWSILTKNPSLSYKFFKRLQLKNQNR